MVTAQSMQRAHSPTGNADLYGLSFILFMEDLEGHWNNSTVKSEAGISVATP
jgi:hypothetical protein